MASLVLTACQNSEERITGKWKAVSYIENGKKDTLNYSIECTPEGEIIISGNESDGFHRRKMTYRLIKDSICFTETIPILDGISEKNECMKFELKDGRLLLISKNGGATKLKRIKEIKD